MTQRALTELLRGKGAHADPIACVEDLSAELAARHVAAFPHSIGQLVFHMNYWMEYELRRIRERDPRTRNRTRRVSRLRRRPAMRRNGIAFGHRWGSFSPSLVSWRSRRRTSYSARLKAPTTATRNLLERSKPCSGRWYRTTAITWGRSRWCGERWERGLRARAETRGRADWSSCGPRFCGPKDLCNLPGSAPILRFAQDDKTVGAVC